jgi:cytochrome P450
MSSMTISGPHCSIGDRFNPLVGEQLDNPYPFYEEARRDDPVFFSSAFHMWVVTRYEDVRSVLSDPGRFSSRHSIDPIAPICPEAQAVLEASGLPLVAQVVNSDPPDHDRWRRVMTKAFSASRMRLLEPRIRQITQSRIDAIQSAGRADMVADFGFPIPLQVIARLFGIGDEHLDVLKRGGLNYVALVSSVVEPGRQVEIAHEVVAYQLFLRDHLQRTRAQPGDDVISEMIEGLGDEPFSDAELVSMMVGIVAAGHESTAHLISNALHLLLSEPDRWRQVVADPSLIPAAVEETLRMDPPIPAFLRTATADTTLGGRAIAMGDMVAVVFASANHDARQFPDPSTFELNRQNATRHVGFGHGIHFCVGAQLARIEARVALESLAVRLPNLRLAPGQDLRHVPTLIFRAFEELKVEWD